MARGRRAKVRENAGLERDTYTSAVINTNKSSYSARVASKRKQSDDERRIKTLESELADLKKLVTELTKK